MFAAGVTVALLVLGIIFGGMGSLFGALFLAA